MIFTDFRFLFFFAAVFIVYWGLQKNTSRKVWLLFCSYLFYSFWNWKFLSLILISTILDYIVGLKIEKSATHKRKKILMIISLVVNLGILGVFKYYDFFTESCIVLFRILGLPFSPHSLHLILPVGISFYTFQTLSYSIDVYRGKLKPSKSFLDFALFVGFFPQLVAGPIERASHFLPQLKKVKNIKLIQARPLLLLFLMGYFKKACVADQLAFILDPYFNKPEIYGIREAWISIWAYPVQFYCDFSGYTDMAIACAGLLGYQLQKNFNFPYFSKSMKIFWWRWHISLSSWFRDYVYSPLSKMLPKSKLMTAMNVVLVMLLCGLWHGAGYNFLFWGFLQAIYIIVFGSFSFSKILRFKKVTDILDISFTFFLVGTSAVFFA